MATMSKFGEWEDYEIRPQRSSNTGGQRIAFVTPQMDIDITGCTPKQVRTHLIDHPRDDGLKQREQLWNFQQRYRGVGNGKLRTVVAKDTEDYKPEQSISFSNNDIIRPISTSRTEHSGDQSSLATRFKRRLKQKNLKLTRIRTRELPSVMPSSQNDVFEKRDTDREVHCIQRLYSSELCVKNSIYNQLKSGDNEEKRNDPKAGDRSRILETIQRHGSLEKLPDVRLPSSINSAQPHSFKFFKTLNPYNRRVFDHLSHRRYIPLQRSFTNITDLGPTKRKLIIVSRRDKSKSREIKLNYLNDNYYEENGIENNEMSEDDGEEGDDEEEEEDEEDEVERQILTERIAKQLHCRDDRQPNTDYLDSFSTAKTQDDMILTRQHADELTTKNQLLRSEKTFSSGGRSTQNRHYTEPDFDSVGQSFEICEDTNFRGIEDGWTSNDSSVKPKTKTSKNLTARYSKRKVFKGKSKRIETRSSSSEEELDIPDDRYGPTTHSVDRKLSIRKPWEWRPSPYRWTDKPYVKESDKPYIERIINRGEIIDEFSYDSYERTKPLKVQAYPEGAGYKDRNGKLR